MHWKPVAVGAGIGVVSAGLCVWYLMPQAPKPSLDQETRKLEVEQRLQVSAPPAPAITSIITAPVPALDDAELEKKFWPLYRRAQKAIQEFQKLERTLLAQHPEVERAKQRLLKWKASFGPGQTFNTADLENYYQKDIPENRETWGQLTEIAIWLALSDWLENEPELQRYIERLLEEPGTLSSMTENIKGTDSIAAYTYPMEEPLSARELKAQLALRKSAYEQAYHRIVLEKSMPRGLHENLRALIRVGIYSELTKQYLQSYYTGPFDPLRTELAAVREEMAAIDPGRGARAQELTKLWEALRFPELWQEP
jgi:hypothetical protein